MSSTARTALVLSLGFALIGLGCASASLMDPTGKRNSLETAQRRYTELVRWGEIERAAEFVDPDMTVEYLENAGAFQGIRFTDFESGHLIFDEEQNTANVVVVYHAYSMSTLLEKKIRETQHWYREPGMNNTWRVKPDLRQIIAGVTGGP
jgi:hypothetical protein